MLKYIFLKIRGLFIVNFYYLFMISRVSRYIKFLKNYLFEILFSTGSFFLISRKLYICIQEKIDDLNIVFQGRWDRQGGSF